MRIISLTLENIRSYKSETVHFPSGIILLAGDIGCGKSTLLLAIEFALFGLRRGEGISLLRYGAKEGTVTVKLNIQGEEHILTRSLKRSGSSIAQDVGSITHKGITTDCTAVELKAKVLALLKYPSSLLSKSNSLVFRYTVYTPQEEMKHILFEKPEDRLDTFRKLFAIDKYQLIRENTTLLARSIKQKSERLLGQAEDLVQIARTKEEQEAQQQQILALKAAQFDQAQRAKERVEAVQAGVAKQEALLQSFLSTKQERSFAVKQLEQFEQQKKSLTSEIQDVRAQCKEQPTTPEAIAEKEIALAKHNDVLKTDLLSLQQKLQENSANGAKLDALFEQAQRNARQIIDLAACPTCKQDVHTSHKEHITAELERKEQKVRERKELISQSQSALQQKLLAIQSAQEELSSQQTSLTQQKERLEQTQRANKILEQKNEQLEALTQKIIAAQEQLDQLTKTLSTLEVDEVYIAQQKKALADAQTAAQQAEVLHARTEEQQKALTQSLAQLTAQIEHKTTAKKEAQALLDEYDWLTKKFTQLMFTIEKQIFATIYHQFNDAFRQWFSLLIEDDTINVRLDHEFTPLVEQNGYESTLQSLSGGEKTSVALAYRLALNKVINQNLQSLNTHDLLILDEPTDGFSTEQLDRVQEVLTHLPLKQILIVSHEQKMESFVDHVIRVVKTDHESKVLG